MENAGTGNNTYEETPPTSPRTPLAAYPLLTRSRTSEFYGFAALSGTSVLFVLYHLWALLPDEWIVTAGVEWYPSREWAFLLPSYSIVVILLTYFTYWAIAVSSTPHFNDPRTITDSHAHVPSSNTRNPYILQADPNALPEMYDLPIGLVTQVLFRRDQGQ